MVHESQLHDEKCMVTLTYNEETVPHILDENDNSYGLTLNKKHLQKFMKRLRRKYDGKQISFYGCGEYGDDFSRPHYHVCLFGHEFSDRESCEPSQTGNEQYVSDTLNRLWKFGYSTISQFNASTAAYCARYCTKKMYGKGAKAYYNDREPEFSHMSRNPAIGKRFYEKYKKDLFDYDECIIDAKRVKIPRYYDKKYEEEFPDCMQRIKTERIKKGEESQTGWRRTAEKEKVKLRQAELLKRKIQDGKVILGKRQQSTLIR